MITPAIERPLCSAKVTVGLPVYNGERYLAERLENILNQSFADFLLVISDNGSADRTGEICAAFAKRDARIQYVRQLVNRGSTWNFNFLLSCCASPCFIMAAVDDLWACDFLEKLVSRLSADDTVAVAFSPYYLIDESNKVISSVLRADYPERNRLVRFCHFAASYKDAAFYGLIRAEALRNVKLSHWWKPNARVLLDGAYPFLCGLLAKGCVVNADSTPGFYCRTWPHEHKGENYFPDTYLKYVLLKFNVFVASLRNIFIASRSIVFTLAVLPWLFLRAVVECITCSRYVRIAWNRSMRPFVTRVRITLERYIFWRWMKEGR